MRARGILLLGLLSCARAQGPPGPVLQGPVRFVEHLDQAVTRPDPPARVVLLPPTGALKQTAETVGIPLDTEAGRDILVRARLRRGPEGTAKLSLWALSEAERNALGPGPVVLRGTLPGRLLARLEPVSTSGSSVIVQHVSHLDERVQGVLLVIESGVRGVENVEASEAEFPDARRTDDPLGSRLLRRMRGLTGTGLSWRTTLLGRADARYGFEVALPPGPELWVALGNETGVRGAPVRFVAKQDGRTLLDQVIAPDRSWHEVRLPLTSTRAGRIELETFAAGSGVARGLWGDPRIVGASDRTNVLLLTVDALRADHLSAYGYPRDTSPGLEAFSKVAVKFTRATAQAGRTWESVSSLLTGRYAANARVRDRGVTLPVDVETLGETLSRAGYETLAGGDVGLFPLETFSGFDEAELAFKDPGTYAKTLAQFERWAPRFARHPTFAWMHLEHTHYALYPHEPLRYHPGYSGRFARQLTLEDHGHFPRPEDVSVEEQQQVRALYDASVREADEAVFGILRALEAAGAAEKTLIIIAADHGEQIAEHGVLLEHVTAYDAVLHVPLFVAWPGHIEGGREVREPVQLVDLVPTVLSSLGLPLPSGLDGRDLSPILQGGSLTPVSSYAELEGRIFSLYEGDFHLLLNPGGWRIGIIPGGLKIQPVELYQRSTDPAELNNLVASPPAELPAMKAKLEQKIAEWEAASHGHGPTQIGQSALRSLREAGYVPGLESAP